MFSAIKRYILRNQASFIFILIMAIASIIRLYNPTFRSLWGDEAHSIFKAFEFLGNPVDTISDLIKDSHMPAYFAFLSVWMRIFGMNELALRLLSALIGIAAVAALFFFARRLLDEKTALISTFLLAFSPLAVMQSQELRVYGLLLLLSILSTHYFWRLLSGKQTLTTAIGYVLFTILLGLTHLYAALIIAAQFVWLIYMYYKEKEHAKFVNILLLQMLSVLLISPFYIKMILMNFSGAMDPNADMAFAVFPSYVKPFLFFFVLSLGETLAPWNYMLVIPAGLIFSFLFIRAFKWISDKRVVFLMIMLLLPVLLSAFLLKPTMPKYLILTLPFYLMLLGYSLSKLKSKMIFWTLIAAITCFQMISVINYFNLTDYHNSHQIEPWKKVSSMIARGYQNGDIIIETNEHISGHILQYYLNIIGRKNYPIMDIRNIDIKSLKVRRFWLVTHIVDERALPQGFIERFLKSAGKRYKLVSEDKFIPYGSTLVSKVPINRHKSGSYRIIIRLFDRR